MFSNMCFLEHNATLNCQTNSRSIRSIEIGDAIAGCQKRTQEFIQKLKKNYWVLVSKCVPSWHGSSSFVKRLDRFCVKLYNLTVRSV